MPRNTIHLNIESMMTMRFFSPTKEESVLRALKEITDIDDDFELVKMEKSGYYKFIDFIHSTIGRLFYKHGAEKYGKYFLVLKSKEKNNIMDFNESLVELQKVVERLQEISESKMHVLISFEYVGK